MTFLTKHPRLPVIIAAVILGLVAFSISATSNNNFVRGKHGSKCYMEGTEHGNIRMPIYFETLEECLKSLSGQ